MRTTSGVRMRPRRVLFIEDDPDEREMYVSAMHAAGWEVRESATGEDAIAIAPEFCPDVVVADLNLPGVDGAATTRLLRAAPHMADVPIIILSAHVARAWEANSARCHTFLSK